MLVQSSLAFNSRTYLTSITWRKNSRNEEANSPHRRTTAEKYTAGGHRPAQRIRDDRRWTFQNPIFRRGGYQTGSKRIACELPNAESRSLRRFREGPNTDKIVFRLEGLCRLPGRHCAAVPI